MHIAIDGTALYGRFGGVEYALWNLLEAIARLEPEHHFSVYIPRDGPPPGDLSAFGPRWRWIRLPFNGARKLRRIYWQQVLLPRRLARDGCELLHSPTYVSPLRSPVPVVLTIYDIIALTHPRFATAANRLHYSLILPRSIARARRVIVPAEGVRAEVEERIPQTAGQVRVVPLGVESIFLAAGETMETDDGERLSNQAAVGERYGLPERFLLFVGNFEPKKNLDNLLSALDLLPDAPPLVVVGGARAWRGSRIEARPGRVQLPGYVSRHDLPWLYSMCELFVFPSLAEGFGLPVLEALACGAPVVTSDAVRLPGLGEVAALCDPTDPHSIAGEIATLMANRELRRELSRAGAQYARSFTWSRTAELTLRVYDEAAQERS